MPLRLLPKDPNAWHRKPFPTRLRKPDAARAQLAAANAGISISELIRRATLKELDRLGVQSPVNPTVNQTAQIFALTSPQMSQDAKAHTQAHVEAFRQSDRYDRPNGPIKQGTIASRETFADTHSGMGMKDTPPRF